MDKIIISKNEILVKYVSPTSSLPPTPNAKLLGFLSVHSISWSLHSFDQSGNLAFFNPFLIRLHFAQLCRLFALSHQLPSSSADYSSRFAKEFYSASSVHLRCCTTSSTVHLFQVSFARVFLWEFQASPLLRRRRTLVTLFEISRFR